MLPDILSENLMIVFCGINPGLKSAADGHHFSGRSNRFWRVLHLAGFTPHEIKAQDDRSMLELGYGLTTAVERPTSRADELSRDEFVAAYGSFKEKMDKYKPEYIAFLGKPAYAVISGKRNLAWGPQDEDFCGAKVWLLPNPSGLNRGFNLSALVTAYEAMLSAVIGE